MLSRPSILVATDFSESSDIALKTAEKLRKKSQGEIHVIHVTPYPEQWDWLTNDVIANYYPDDFKKNLMESLHTELLAQLKRCGVVGKGEILMGPKAKTILEYLSHSHFDLAVLGHKKKGKFFNPEGVASKVMGGANIPVLIANEDIDVEHVAGLVDPLKPEEKIFSITKELGSICSGDMEFISVWSDEVAFDEETFPKTYPVTMLSESKKKEAKSKMESILQKNIDKDLPVKIKTEISGAGKVSGVVKILNEDHIDLAVMNKHQKGKIEKFFLGSVTRGVLDNWHGNLLVLPPG